MTGLVSSTSQPLSLYCVLLTILLALPIPVFATMNDAKEEEALRAWNGVECDCDCCHIAAPLRAVVTVRLPPARLESPPPVVAAMTESELTATVDVDDLLTSEVSERSITVIDERAGTVPAGEESAPSAGVDAAGVDVPDDALLFGARDEPVDKTLFDVEEAAVECKEACVAEGIGAGKRNGCPLTI